MKCNLAVYREEHGLKLSLSKLYDRLKEAGYNPDFDEEQAARGRLVVHDFGGLTVVFGSRTVWCSGNDPEKVKSALVSALDLLERERAFIVLNR